MINRQDVITTCDRSAAYADRQHDIARRGPQTARQMATAEYWRGWRDAARALAAIFDSDRY